MAGPETDRLGIVAVIALYNGAAFVERALASVRAQTHPADEVVVVDDGSTDAGPELVSRLAATWPELTLVRKPNGGQSSARNLGVARSRSELIAFLDQDDFWYSDHLARLLESLSAQPSATGWSYADVDVGDRDGQLTEPAFLHTRPARHPKTSQRDCMADDMFILPSASLIRRAAFETVGGFDEKLSGYEDDDLFLRLLAAGFGNVFVDAPLSMWRIYGASTTFTPAMARSRMIFAKKLLARCDELGGTDGAATRRAIAPRFTRNLLGEYVRAARRRDGAVMTDSVADIRRWFLPHLPPLRRWLLRVGLAVLDIHPVGRLVASEHVIPAARRVARLPQPPHVKS